MKRIILLSGIILAIPSDLSGRDTLALGEQIAFTAPGGEENGKFSCAAACSASTPFCRSMAQPTELKNGLSYLRTQLSGSAPSIPVSQIKSKFGVTDDPCGRGDTLRNGTELTNVGEACELRASAKLVPQFDPIEIKMSIPKILRIKVSRDGSVREYEIIDEPVRLQINDPDLQNDWGGVVIEVRDTGNRIQFQMPRGCIQLEG